MTLFRSLLLILVSVAGLSAVETITTLDLTSGQGSVVGNTKPITLPFTGTEQGLTIKITGGSPHWVQIGSTDANAQGWILRWVYTQTPGQVYVAANQTYNLYCDATVTVHFLQQTAGGDLVVVPLK